MRIANRLWQIIRHGRLVATITIDRKPDFIVGEPDQPYLRRWWLIPRNPVLNVYLHQFLRDDDDRALHDHPWFWCSIILQGGYIEHTIAAGGIHRRRVRREFSMRFGTPWGAHRIELIKAGSPEAAEHSATSPGQTVPCWTLFITGPRLRNWGFHCPKLGWVPWQVFTDPNNAGRTGFGCGDERLTDLQRDLRRIDRAMNDNNPSSSSKEG